MMKRAFLFIFGLSLAVTVSAEITGIVTFPGGSDTQVQYNNGGTFEGDSDMTFNGSTLTVTGLSAGRIAGATMTISGLTSGRAPFATTGGQLTDDSDFTFNGTTASIAGVSATNASVSGLTTLGTVTAGAVTATTMDTGQGANELYDMDQNVLTTDNVTFGTVNTGQGANELYDMNQNVQTGDSPTFAGLTVSGLTSSRVAFSGSGGILQDDPDMTFNGTTATVAGASLTNLLVSGASTLGAVSATSLTDSGLTNGRVVMAGGGGILEDFSSFTMNGTTLAFTGPATFATSSGKVGIGLSTPIDNFSLTTNSGITIGKNDFSSTWNSDQGGLHMEMPFAKNADSSGGSGTIKIFSNDTHASVLQGTVGLRTSSTATLRGLLIESIEQGTDYRTIFMNQNGGSVVVGSTNAAIGKFQVRQAQDENLIIENTGSTVSGAVTLHAVNDANSANVPLEVRATQTIFSAGGVAIGGTTPSTNLHILNNTSSTQYREMLRLDGGTLSNGWERGLTWYGDTTNEMGRITLYLTGVTREMRFIVDETTGAIVSQAGAWRFNAYGAGTLTTDASGNITAVSDERMKSAIKPFTRGLKDILGINPIVYRWNEKSGMETVNRYAGFSAQNVRKFIPEAVMANNAGIYSLQDRPIMATMLNAIRELSASVDMLKKRVDELEANNVE